MAGEDHSDNEIEMMVAGAKSLLADVWPEDRTERIEAKLDKVLGNHLPHVEARISRLERIIKSKQRMAFWTSVATIIVIVAVAFIR